MFFPRAFTSFPTLLLILPVVLSLPNPQMPMPPPDACFRRNDTLPACPYGGQCHPDQNHTCTTGCVNYQYSDARFWCNVVCGYKATSLQGEIAPNPMFCIQPVAKTPMPCESNWACYRQFGSQAPEFRSKGPVCSPAFDACTPGAPTGGYSNSTSECDVGSVCIKDPRPGLTKLALVGEVSPGICVPASQTAKTCTGKQWDECGDAEICAADPRSAAELGNGGTGLCVKLIGALEESSNSTMVDISRRGVITKRC